jgi:hypothetical protein
MQDNLLAGQLMTQGMHADEADGDHHRPHAGQGRHIGVEVIGSELSI